MPIVRKVADFVGRTIHPDGYWPLEFKKGSGVLLQLCFFVFFISDVPAN